MSDERADKLQALAEEIRHCTACPLHRTRINAVPGEGPADAQIMFIGEGPGFHEDQQGRPFVGPSGRLLEQLLAEIGLTRRQVFIANIVKCRPPNNRDPLPQEIAACAPFLERQIELVDPQLIATLGRYSMEKFFPGARISKVHGKAERRGRRVFLPLFHPAYVLRNADALPLALRDVRLIPRLLQRHAELLAQEAAAPETPPAEPAAPDQAPPEPASEYQQLSLL